MDVVYTLEYGCPEAGDNEVLVAPYRTAQDAVDDACARLAEMREEYDEDGQWSEFVVETVDEIDDGLCLIRLLGIHCVTEDAHELDYFRVREYYL